MKARELAEWLLTDPDADVFYGDPNFGGRGDEFEKGNIQFENGMFLIECPFWEDVDADYYNSASDDD